MRSSGCGSDRHDPGLAWLKPTLCAAVACCSLTVLSSGGCGGRTAGGIDRDGSVDSGDCGVICTCPEHARGDQPMRYCSGDSVFECTAEYVQGCGWSCTVTFYAECDYGCADPMDGLALCCPAPDVECPERVFEGDGLFCYQNDLYLCVEIEDPYCGVIQQGEFQEYCPYGCGDMTPGYALCCPLMEWQCPDYLNATGGGLFCQGDDLYNCGLACHPDCGCSGVADFVQTCTNGCTDNQDGQADCDPTP